MKLGPNNLPAGILRAQQRPPALRSPVNSAEDTARNWTEGRDYMGTCHDCGLSFLGPKWRIQGRKCRKCAEQDVQSPIPAPEPPPEPRAEPGTAQTASALCGVKFGPLVIGERRKAPGLSKPRGRKGMNKTESAFALRLEALKRAGEIVRWDREGITMRMPDGLSYTCDFSVIRPSEFGILLVLIETKGAYIEPHALVRFRSFRAYFPEFIFEMHQLKRGMWEKIL